MAQDYFPKEWYHSLWAGSYVNYQSRQSSTVMARGQYNLSNPSVESHFSGDFRLYQVNSKGYQGPLYSGELGLHLV